MSCVICENCLGKTFSLILKKDNEYFHTCSYTCNMKMAENFDKDFWTYVINKSDFINPLVKGNPFKEIIKKNSEIIPSIDFENMDENSDLMLDGERYERLYKIYLENKRVDEILDEKSETSSNYSDDY
jgi:hypothetical protein